VRAIKKNGGPAENAEADITRRLLRRSHRGRHSLGVFTVTTRRGKGPEQKLAEKVKTWLSKDPKYKHCDITAQCRASKTTDVLVRSGSKLVLQVETKAENSNLWEGVGEAMYYNMEKEHEDVPTFLAVPYCLRRHIRVQWDGWEEAMKIYQHYNVNIGVFMVTKDGKVEVKHDPKNVFTKR
jgi:hypothetical protein